jgi:hypothetical protein
LKNGSVSQGDAHILKLACEDTREIEAKIFATRAIILVFPAALILSSYAHIARTVLKVKSILVIEKPLKLVDPTSWWFLYSIAQVFTHTSNLLTAILRAKESLLPFFTLYSTPCSIL